MAGDERQSVGGVRVSRRALLFGAMVIVLCAGWLGLVTIHWDRTSSLSWILAISAVAAGLLVGGEHEQPTVSAAFIVSILAAAFLGPASAAAAAVVAELTAAMRLHTRLRSVVLINLPASAIPAAAAGLLVHAVAGGYSDKPSFYLTVALAGAVDYSLSFCIFAAMRRSVGQSIPIKAFVESLPSAALNILLVVAGAAIYLKVGIRGIAFALAAVGAFSYMAHLLAQSRRRAEQYVSLSWGVLAGLMRSLDIRDQRAARHAAAVAGFARDIAKTVGMNERDCELAHTAGLLHDIGNFALSDRVAERGRTLTEEDWMAIQRHPELGADMLKDLGMYGPVGEIVLAHHERVDGRGYPQGLTGDEIPEIAKIIAVAEVYDTLTASDTYRTRMSSFEALRELRRVAGSQLDGVYVEVLAQLLSGEGVDYRHADSADFDTELDMERRIGEAGAGG
jgi:putative nucleotidyltransferase with HDIG domain